MAVNRRWSWVVLFALALLVVFGLRGSTVLSNSTRDRVPVLLYHMITPSNVSNNGAIVPDFQFLDEMATLRDHGCHAISLDQFQDWLVGNGTLPSNPVLITFDDGYESTLTLAQPVLKQYGFHATVFMIGDLIGHRSSELSYLDWPEIKQLATGGLFTLAYHTMNGHVEIEGKPALLTWTSAQVVADLGRERDLFESHGISLAPALAYPYGATAPAVRSALKQFGIVTAYTTTAGLASRSGEPLMIPRQIVWPAVGQGEFLRLLGTR